MRVQITRSKNAECFFIVKSVYENGKRSNRVVEKLGNLEQVKARAGKQDPYEWAKEYAEKLTQQEKEMSREIMLRFKPNEQMERNKQVTYNGGYLFLQKLYHELGLDKICAHISEQYKFQYDLDAIVSRLIYGRVLFPSSKSETMELSQSLLEPPNFDLHQIYRALEVIAKENDYIQAELYKNSSKVAARNDRILYYDVTNYYFEAEEANGLRQYGVSKENRPNPIVEMGLFMDGDGIPLAFCIHPGNSNEQTTLKPLEKKILSDFDHSEFVVCTDAGLSSYDNRKFNSILNRKFITVQSIRKMKEIQKQWALSPQGWRVSGSKIVYDLNEVRENPEGFEETTFFKETWINENGLEQRYIVTFSLKYMKYQQNLRTEHIKRAQKALSQPSMIGKLRNTDYKRFIGKIESTENGEVAEVATYFLNEDLMAEEAKYDGFYAVATNLEDDAQAIIEANGRRWEIEESFRIMKSEMRARPVYLSRDDRIQAHFTTCFLALTLYRYLEKKVDCQFTCHELISTLRTMNFLKISGEGYLPAYTRTNITDKLHDAFGFRTDFKFIPSSKMKKILKETKI